MSQIKLFAGPFFLVRSGARTARASLAPLGTTGQADPLTLLPRSLTGTSHPDLAQRVAKRFVSHIDLG